MSATVDQLIDSYEKAFAAEAEGGEGIYGSASAWSAMTWAAHERRIALLADLPLPDLAGKTVLDFGCGPWGFAAIFPRLWECGKAIGIDISPTAARVSAEKTAAGSFPFGSNYQFLTSNGDSIDLPTGSVDLVFSGECIEHVENTDAYLDEMHRILSPGGTLILTTPNADGYLYQLRGDRYTIGPEHVALMSYPQLLDYLRPRFDVVVAKGFNGSVFDEWDNRIQDRAFADAWAAVPEDRPDLATGLVLMVRKKDDYRPRRYRSERLHHTSPAVRYEGEWRELTLHRSMTARVGTPGWGSRLSVPFGGTTLLVFLWCHAWSGAVEVAVDGVARDVSLYSRCGGFMRLEFRDLAAGVPHTLTVRPTGPSPAGGAEVLFYQALAYEPAGDS